MKDKPIIAISACLLGHKVRYDGRTNANEYILTELSTLFQFKPICPEVAIGLSVPRKPMHLVYVNNQVQALLLEDHSINFTQNLISYADQVLPELACASGFIFKSKSPSCGVNTTPVGDDWTNGIFSQSILSHLPGLPILDESQLQTIDQRLQFIDAVKAYSQQFKK